VVSRQLGPELFGVFSFLTTILVAASCFANLGLDTWMAREITKDPGRGKHYLSNVLGLKIGSSLITISLVFLIFQSTDLPATTQDLLWVIPASILFNSLSQALWHYGNCFKEFVYHSVLGLIKCY
jgi:O-antigen/teichoic acid export membrane protein